MKKSEKIKQEFNNFRQKCLNNYSYGIISMGGSLAAVIYLVSGGSGAVLNQGLSSGAAFLSAGGGTNFLITGAALLSAGVGANFFIKGNQYQKKAVELKEDFYDACSEELLEEVEENEKRDKKLMELQIVVAKLRDQKMQLETIKVRRQEEFNQPVEVQPQMVNQPLKIQPQETIEIEQPTHKHTI